MILVLLLSVLLHSFNFEIDCSPIEDKQPSADYYNSKDYLFQLSDESESEPEFGDLIFYEFLILFYLLSYYLLYS
jgi:hypothetical protein